MGYFFPQSPHSHLLGFWKVERGDFTHDKRLCWPPAWLSPAWWSSERVQLSCSALGFSSTGRKYLKIIDLDPCIDGMYLLSCSINNGNTVNKTTKLKPKVSFALPLVSLQVHIAFSMYAPSSISPTDGEFFVYHGWEVKPVNTILRICPLLFPCCKLPVEMVMKEILQKARYGILWPNLEPKSFSTIKFLPILIIP